MFKYAQIDADGNCIGVSFLSGESVEDHMILLSEADNVNPRDIYDQVNGTWTAAPPLPPLGPTLEEKYTTLEQQLAQTNADLAAVLEMIVAP